jgi:hypothetical protein
MVEPHPMIEEEIIHLGGNMVQRVPKVERVSRTLGPSEFREAATPTAP